MEEKFDYLKFKCDIYSVDGMLIRTVRVNSEHLFYGPDLVVNQDYYIIFSYDGILIHAILFTSSQAGKVVYLSPAQIIFKYELEDFPNNLMQVIKPMMKKHNDFHIPNMSWDATGMDQYKAKPQPKPKKSGCKKRPGKFKAGNELSGQVK